jgi:hypothetical protein
MPPAPVPVTAVVTALDSSARKPPHKRNESIAGDRRRSVGAPRSAVSSPHVGPHGVRIRFACPCADSKHAAGWLDMWQQFAKDWQHLFFHLDRQNRCLNYSASPDEASKRATAQCVPLCRLSDGARARPVQAPNKSVPLTAQTLLVDMDPSRPDASACGFTIVNPHKSVVLRAADVAQALSWKDSIASVIAGRASVSAPAPSASATPSAGTPAAAATLRGPAGGVGAPGIKSPAAAAAAVPAPAPAPSRPVEDDWVCYNDPNTGADYWYNTKTGQSAWEKPQA